MLKIDESKFVNLELERNVLSGIFRSPEIFFDLETIIKSEDFNEKIHQVVWSIFGELLKKNEKVDYRLCAYKINELGVNFHLDLSISDYFEAIYFMGVQSEMTMQYAKELKKLSGKKEIAKAGADVVNKMLEINSDASYSEIVKIADSTFNGKINNFEIGGIQQPIDVFANLEAEIENESTDGKNNEIICPYPRMQKMFGDFIPGEMYFWCARPKSSKSTFLMNLGLQCSTDISDTVQTLYLDTELNTDKVKYRLLSAISGVNEYFIRTKKWRLNPDMVKAIREAWPKVKLWQDTISHIYVANMPVEDVISIIRRWIKKSNPKAKKIVIFDYLKLGDEFHKISNNTRPDLVLGRKVDMLKKAGEELGFVCLSAAQNNRSGEISRTGNAMERRDDGAVIGQSDQISQFASQIYVLGKLTANEHIELETNFGVKNATHFCKSIYSRNLGEEACMGFNDLVKIQVGDKVEWRENVLYYNITNFLCTEITDLASLVKDRKEYALPPSYEGDGELM